MRKLLALAAATGAMMMIATPASATWDPCKWNPKKCQPSSTGGTTTGGTTTGGTAVPEPGMIGLFGAGLIGLALVRRRRKNRG